jgi:hypothetical protein
MSTQVINTTYMGKPAGTLEVDVKQINLIYGSKEMGNALQLEYPGCMVLTPEYTKYHGDRVQEWHPETERMFRLVFTEWGDECTPDSVRMAGEAAICCSALLDMTLKLGDLGVKVVWKYPEHMLHPGYQTGLADAAVQITNMWKEQEGQDESAEREALD